MEQNNSFIFSNDENSLYWFLKERPGASFLYKSAILERDSINNVFSGCVERVGELQQGFEEIITGYKRGLEENRKFLSHLLSSVSLAAVRAGLDSSLAFMLLNRYQAQCEKAATNEQILHIFGASLNDLCNQVLQTELPVFSDEKITGVARYIDSNCTGNISLEDIAAFSGYTKEHLCRRFKAVTRKTITQYIRDARIFLACRILKTTDKSVADISDYLSFHSQSYFQKVFKQTTGMTPLEFKKHGIF